MADISTTPTVYTEEMADLPGLCTALPVSAPPPLGSSSPSASCLSASYPWQLPVSPYVKHQYPKEKETAQVELCNIKIKCS